MYVFQMQQVARQRNEDLARTTRYAFHGRNIALARSVPAWVVATAAPSATAAGRGSRVRTREDKAARRRANRRNAKQMAVTPH
jgi:heterodisulfide reductase subunit B